MTQHKTPADEIESMKDAAAIFAAKQGLQRDTEKFKAGADFVFEMLEVFIKENNASQFIKKDEATTGHLKMIGEAFDASERIRTGQLKKEVVSSDVEQANHYQKASDKFAAFVKTKYDQKDHNTMYLFDNMIDAIYQSVLSGLIDECFGEQSTQQPATINAELEKQNAELVDIVKEGVSLIEQLIEDGVILSGAERVNDFLDSTRKII